MYNIPSSPDDGQAKLQKKKRVGKACDSCRIKKTKCNGKKPCNKCIQDNKICVFTEKKKFKEKNYPNGYVELLETRLDLLTKSFEKMIQLSTPHLKFLRELVVSPSGGDTNAPDNDDNEYLVPINKVINYLINNEGLLKNLPLEWENGAMIAANYTSNDMENALKQFENHKLNLDNNGNHDYDSQLQSQLQNPPPGPTMNPQSSQDQNLPEYQEFNDNIDDDELMNLSQFQLGGYSTGGFVLANSAALNDGISNDLSDFESDLNSIYSANLNSPGLSPGLSSNNLSNNANNLHANPAMQGGGNFEIRPSLFENNSRDLFFNNHHNNSSATSLHEKPFSPNTISPSSTFDTGNNSHPNSQPSSLMHNPQPHHNHSHLHSQKRIQRPRSPSFQKLKNSGHVHKPLKNDYDIKSSLLDNDLVPSDSISESIKYDLNYDDGNILKDL